MHEVLDLSYLWAQIGGFNGLVVLNLFVLVGALVFQVMRISNRLLDFKASMYNAGILPDRRNRDHHVLIRRRGGKEDGGQSE